MNQISFILTSALALTLALILTSTSAIDDLLLMDDGGSGDVDAPCMCPDEKMIKPGEWHAVTECEWCYCSRGHQVVTTMSDCFYVECVDFRHEIGDGRCCPVCPNGRNCLAEVGGIQRIIGYGERWKLLDWICYCVERNISDIKRYYPVAKCEFYETANLGK